MTIVDPGNYSAGAALPDPSVADESFQFYSWTYVFIYPRKGRFGGVKHYNKRLNIKIIWLKNQSLFKRISEFKSIFSGKNLS